MRPTPARVRRLLDELALRPGPGPDPELAALEVAILLEDGLGVVLDDADIERLAQEGPAAAEDLVARAPEDPR